MAIAPQRPAIRIDSLDNSQHLGMLRTPAQQTDIQAMQMNLLVSGTDSVTGKPFDNLADIDGQNENLNLQIGVQGSPEQFTGTQWSDGEDA